MRILSGTPAILFSICSATISYRDLPKILVSHIPLGAFRRSSLRLSTRSSDCFFTPDHRRNFRCDIRSDNVQRRCSGCDLHSVLISLFEYFRLFYRHFMKLRFPRYHNLYLPPASWHLSACHKFFRLENSFKSPKNWASFLYLLLHQLRNDPVIQRFKQFQP